MKVKSFDQNLQNILVLISKMSDLALESVDIIEKAIDSNDSLVNKAFEHDDKINQFNADIEKEVLNFISSNQSKAEEIKFAICALKSTTNLERIGDYAKKAVKLISRSDVAKTYVDDLKEMLKLAKNMIKTASDSLINIDLNKANEVLEKDDEIDAIYQAIFKSSKKQNLNDNSPIFIDTIFIAKAIERLADHAVNISAIINYYHKN